MNIIVTPEEFVDNYGDFVLIYAIDAVRYNFMEVVRRLRIEEEVEMFFGRTLDKYTAMDQFEIIIRDTIAGTPTEKYENLLLKMHKSFVFPDHLLIVNPEKLEVDLLNQIRIIIATKLLCNSRYWTKGPGKPDTLKHISVTVDDFRLGRTGLFCFVLLHKDDYSCLDPEDIARVFREAGTLNLF